MIIDCFIDYINNSNEISSEEINSKLETYNSQCDEDEKITLTKEKDKTTRYLSTKKNNNPFFIDPELMRIESKMFVLASIYFEIYCRKSIISDEKKTNVRSSLADFFKEKMLYIQGLRLN